jgi:hypothetical protein
MRHVKSTFIIVAAALLLALPSAALAQTGGYGPGQGVLGEENASGGGAPTSNNNNGGGGNEAAPTTVESGANNGGTLPFTGADLIVIAAIGMALLGAGIGLRRLRDNP